MVILYWLWIKNIPLPFYQIVYLLSLLKIKHVSPDILVYFLVYFGDDSQINSVRNTFWDQSNQILRDS